MLKIAVIGDLVIAFTPIDGSAKICAGVRSSILAAVTATKTSPCNAVIATGVLSSASAWATVR